MMRSMMAGTGVALLVFTGCGDTVQVGSPGGSRPGGPAGGAGPARAVVAVDASLPSLDYRDEDFTEAAELNRDPFRSFAGAFRTRAVAEPTVNVVMRNTSVEEMRLVALITGVDQPRGMLVDSTGMGHVVQRGDFVGRAVTTQMDDTEGVSVPLYWRVDRIRANELVLILEDRRTSDRPPQTRVIALHADARGEAAQRP